MPFPNYDNTLLLLFFILSFWQYSTSI